MTDAISQYGRQNLSDNAVRNSADKVKKSSTSQSASSTGSTGSSERSAPASRGEDTVALSSVAQRAMAEPDFDRAKVEAIKQAISEGQYPLDSRRIAESFVAIERMIRE
jgi:negative regulator of flagellin synthesis FlgM